MFHVSIRFFIAQCNCNCQRPFYTALSALLNEFKAINMQFYSGLLIVIAALFNFRFFMVEKYAH